MNRDSKLRLLREILSTNLDEACSFMVHVNTVVKRMEGHRSLLLSKRDQALQKLKATYEEAEMLLKKTHHLTEQDITDMAQKKECNLVTNINQLIKIINETAEISGAIEEVLEVGNEDKLLHNGPDLENQIQKLLTKKNKKLEANLRDIIELEFLPNESIKQRFGNKAFLGFVKSREAEPEGIDTYLGGGDNLHSQMTPQKRPNPTMERKRATVCRSHLQGIKSHIQSNQMVNQNVTDAMIKEELPRPPGLGNYPAQTNSYFSAVRIKEEPKSPPTVFDQTPPLFNQVCGGFRRKEGSKSPDDFIHQLPSTAFTNETTAQYFIREETSQHPEKLGPQKIYLNTNSPPNTATYNQDSSISSKKNMVSDSAPNTSAMFSQSTSHFKTSSKIKSEPVWESNDKESREGLYIPPAFRNNSEKPALQGARTDTWTSARSKAPGFGTEGRHSRVLVNKCDNVENWRQPVDTTQDKKRRLVDPKYWEKNLAPDSGTSNSAAPKAAGSNSIQSKSVLTGAQVKSEIAGTKTEGLPISNVSNVTEQKATNVLDSKKTSPAAMPLMKTTTCEKKPYDQWEKAVASVSEAVSRVKLHSGNPSKPVTNQLQPSQGNSKAWNVKIKPAAFNVKHTTGEGSGVAESEPSTEADSKRHSRMRFPRAEDMADCNNNNKATVPAASVSPPQVPSRQPVSDNFQGFGVKSSFTFQFIPTGSENSSAAKVQDTEENPSERSSVREKTKTIIDRSLKHGVTVIKAEFIRRIGRPDVDLRFPIGVTVTKNRTIVVCNSGANNVKMFNWAGQLKVTLKGAKNQLASEGSSAIKQVVIPALKTSSKIQSYNVVEHGVEKMDKPSAVVADENEDIYIKDNRCIWVFSILGTFARKFGNNLLRRPYGLAFNSEGDLVVLNYDYKEVHILVFNKMGQLLKKSLFSPIHNSNLRDKSRCRFLDIVHSDELLVVSDLGVNEVFVTDLSGNTVTQFGEYGGLTGQFREPSGIAVDACGNLVIADSKNNRIQVYNKAGQFKATVIFDREKISRPSDIFVSDEGYLFVSNLLGHCVNIYKIKESVLSL